MSAPADRARAGWMVATGLAAVVAGARVADTRRTRALNRALHELRRPLQALALGTGAPAGANGSAPPQLELAICALGDLDRAINGEPALPRRRLLRLRPLVEGCVERWGHASGPAEHAIELEWRAGTAAIVADPHRIAQALDNLVLNAIEHGAAPIEIRVEARGRGVRIAVEDGGSSTARADRAGRRRRPARGGHGLRVVARIAAEHGGGFAIHRGPDGTVATMELPLASLPVPALAGARAA